MVSKTLETSTGTSASALAVVADIANGVLGVSLGFRENGVMRFSLQAKRVEMRLGIGEDSVQALTLT